ncbi:MAG TPA: S9 family peptidase [Steroidobacteraceae bacterium]|nr:S9 family peptidase [Steroidobacteraceae bacterium]
MKNRKLPVVALWSVACAAVFASGAGKAADEPPPVAAFAAEIDYGDPALSPDGRRVVMVVRNSNERILVSLDLASKEVHGLMPATVDRFEVYRCGFKSDVRVLCGLIGTDFSAGQPYPTTRLVAVDAVGKPKPHMLFQNMLEQNSNHNLSQFQDRILDYQVDDPKHVLIQLADERGVTPAVWSLDVYDGSKSVVQRAYPPVLNWLIDPAGVVRFGSGSDDRRSLFITRDSAQDEWRTLAKWDFGGANFHVVGFGPKPGSLLISANYQGRNAIYDMDLAEKADRKLLLANDFVDIGDPIVWPADRRLVGFEVEAERRKRFIFDDEAAAVYATIDASLPGADNSVLGTSRDGNIVLIKSVTDVRPPEYLVLDRQEKKLRRIGNGNPQLPARQYARMKPVKIPGPGGATLPGYLTLPVGSDGKKVPLVVYPHGGPHARDSWGWDFMVQFMASRGYAVLQVNFRGSTGYGWDWYEAGLQHWGTVMVDDITAATRWAISEGIADPARTCIVGWSYGGYAALMSAAREPDLYNCAVSIAGVSDLRALAREDVRFYLGRKSMEQVLGTDDDELKAGSPRRNAGKITIPVLFVHGDDDYRVAVEQSTSMARALSGKPEVVIIKNGNHSLTRAEWRETLLTKLETFLAANIDGKK